METTVEKVVGSLRHRLQEQLTLDDLAKMARFSKFHFARMFRKVTGVSPRRYLYALRLHEAKRLLITTSASVAEISNQVGYSSVGTFTSRFVASVGISPAQYRRLGGNVGPMLECEPVDPEAPGTLVGQCRGESFGPALVGLLRRPEPDNKPVWYTPVDGARRWSFPRVPAGNWYVLALGWPGPEPPPPDQLPMFIATHGPIKFGKEPTVAELTLTLRPTRAVDPPILFPWAAICSSMFKDPQLV